MRQSLTTLSLAIVMLGKPDAHFKGGYTQPATARRLSLCFHAAVRTVQGTAFLSPAPLVLGPISHQSAIRLEVPR